MQIVSSLNELLGVLEAEKTNSLTLQIFIMEGLKRHNILDDFIQTGWKFTFKEGLASTSTTPTQYFNLGPIQIYLHKLWKFTFLRFNSPSQNTIFGYNVSCFEPYAAGSRTVKTTFNSFIICKVISKILTNTPRGQGISGYQ